MQTIRKVPQPPLLITISKPATPRNGNSPISQPSSPTFLGAWSSRPSPLPPHTPLSTDDQSQLPDLTGHIFPLKLQEFSIGGYGDVSKACWKKGSQRYFVAVKHLRPHSNVVDNKDKTEKRLRREILVWKRLKHPNIVPLLGTTSNLGNIPLTGISMVSAWMKNGNLSDFLNNELLIIHERLQILCDVADGLTYLHSHDIIIIHGDLTGTNILINERREACLVDFGMSSVKAEFEGTSYWSSTIGGAMRWRAPELLPTLGTDVYTFTPELTPACDIYSFGCVMLHVLSNRVPYHDISRVENVLFELFRRKLPRRPDTHILTNEYWSFINNCWGVTPSSRPCAAELYASVVTLRDATANFLEGPYYIV